MVLIGGKVVPLAKFGKKPVDQGFRPDPPSTALTVPGSDRVGEEHGEATRATEPAPCSETADALYVQYPDHVPFRCSHARC